MQLAISTEFMTRPHYVNVIWYNSKLHTLHVCSNGVFGKITIYVQRKKRKKRKKMKKRKKEKKMKLVIIKGRKEGRKEAWEERRRKKKKKKKGRKFNSKYRRKLKERNIL